MGDQLVSLDRNEYPNATAIYSRLLRSMIDGYINRSTSLLDRAFHAWISFSSSFAYLTVLRFMNLSEKLSLYQKIKNENEQAISPALCFPLHPDVPIFTSLPAAVEIEKTTGYVAEVGIMTFFRKVGLVDRVRLNHYVRMLFVGQGILDDMIQEVNDEPTFHAMRVRDTVNDQFIHEPSACRAFTEKNQNISADRTRRVTQTC